MFISPCYLSVQHIVGCDIDSICEMNSRTSHLQNDIICLCGEKESGVITRPNCKPSFRLCAERKNLCCKPVAKKLNKMKEVKQKLKRARRSPVIEGNQSKTDSSGEPIK